MPGASVQFNLQRRYTTLNFSVDAPTPAIAQQIGQEAERLRRDKAIEWLGREMPTWSRPCPIRVAVTVGQAGGSTTFAFAGGQVLSQVMQVNGPLDRIVASVLPHEVSHTILAHHFGRPLPRWADEGGAMLAEDGREQERFQGHCLGLVKQTKHIPLRRLFQLTEYPSDVMALYSEGYSLTNYLVAQKGRPVFLQFVGQALRDGWDRALQDHYGYSSTEALEKEWVAAGCRPLLGGRPKPTTQAPVQPSPVQPVPPPQPGPSIQPPTDPGILNKIEQVAKDVEAGRLERGKLTERLGQAESLIGKAHEALDMLHQGTGQTIPRIQKAEEAIGRVQDGLGKAQAVADTFGRIESKLGQMEPALAGAAQVGSWASWLPWIAGGAATGGVALPIAGLVLGIRVLTRRKSGTAGSVNPIPATPGPIFVPPSAWLPTQPVPAPAQPTQVVVPPLPARTEAHYVGVPASNTELQALKVAMDKYAQMYPGAAGVMQTVQKLAKTIESGGQQL